MYLWKDSNGNVRGAISLASGNLRFDVTRKPVVFMLLEVKTSTLNMEIAASWRCW
jgi:hypothetical protein